MPRHVPARPGATSSVTFRASRTPRLRTCRSRGCSTSCSTASSASSTWTRPRSSCSRTTAARWCRARRRASRRRSSGGSASPSARASRVASPATREAVRITDLEHAEIVNPLLREKGLKSLLGVPLIVEGAVIGVLHVGSLEERDFTDDDVELLMSAGDRAALADPGPAGRARARAGRRAPGEPHADAAGGARRGPRGPLSAGGVGEARRRLVRRLRAARRPARHDDRRRVRPGLPCRRADGPASQRAACLRDGPRLARRGGRAAQQPAPPARARAQCDAALPRCSIRRRAASPRRRRPPAAARAGRATAAAEYLELPGSVPLGRGPLRALRGGGGAARAGRDAPALHGRDRRAPGRAARRGPRRGCRDAVAGAEPRAAGDLRRDPRGDAPGRRDPRRRGAARGARAAARRTRSSCGFPRTWTRSRRSGACSGAGCARRSATTVEIEEISLACSEACANAIEHAYAPGPAAIEVHRHGHRATARPSSACATSAAGARRGAATAAAGWC